MAARPLTCPPPKTSTTTTTSALSLPSLSSASSISGSPDLEFEGRLSSSRTVPIRSLPPPASHTNRIMAGPTSPSADGPTFAPPQLPAGWIAQWDGASKKYYYVQLSTGVSQWEIPTQAVQTGNTPAQQAEHPYGTPQPEVITHPDGSQTIRHSDGTMEPILPPGLNAPGNGPTGDRGLGVSCSPNHPLFYLVRSWAHEADHSWSI